MKTEIGQEVKIWYVNRVPVANEKDAREAARRAGIQFTRIKVKTRFRSLPMGIFTSRRMAVEDSKRFLKRT